MAFVVAAPGTHPAAEEIIAWTRDRLANYKVPRTVAVVSELPINAGGKVETKQLRALAATAMVQR